MVLALTAYEPNTDNIIHESKWAISKRCGNSIYKIFLHDSYPKIRKEVLLLQLSLGRKVKLSFDNMDKHWICESDYMDLHPFINNIRIDELVLQLRDIFNTWEYDSRYLDLISDEWSESVIPWYCMLLRQYIPNSEEHISWLQHSRGEHFVHGDFTLSNVCLDNSKKVVVIDYENATLGPFLWDETTLVYSMIEQEQYVTARYLFEEFSCKNEMLRAICSIRLALSIRKSQNVRQRTEAYSYIFRNY